MISTAHDSVPDLIRGLRSQSAEARCRAAKSLSRLGRSALDAMSALSNALNDAEPEVREAAAQALGQLGPDSFFYLKSMCSHDDKYVRRHAVWALGKLGQLAVSAIPVLCSTLKDVDPRTASGAAQALGGLGASASDAVPMLTEAMRGTNIVLCRLAAKALSEIGMPALPHLIDHLHHSDPFIRGEAALAIGWIGPIAVEATIPLIETLNLGRPSLLEKEVPIADVAPNAVATPDESARANAATALGRVHPKAHLAQNALKHALRDPSEHVRVAAKIALRQIGGA